MQKRWTASAYAFFKPEVSIGHRKGCCIHVFQCTNTGCKHTVRRYIGMGNTLSTGNLRKHIKSCWGREALQAADEKRSAMNAREVVKPYRRMQDIKVVFGNVGKKTITLSTREHTPSEARYDHYLPEVNITDQLEGRRLYGGSPRACDHTTL